MAPARVAMTVLPRSTRARGNDGAPIVTRCAWTLATLLVPIGWYRWSRTLTGVAGINEFEADAGRASGWYQRAHRAHANCLENLPLYMALVVAIEATGVA